MKENTHPDYPAFATRSDWHNAFLLNLGLILLCVYLCILYSHKIICGIAIGLPLLVYTFTSRFFTINRCPREQIVFDNWKLVFSIILIALLTILSCQLIKLPWYCFFALYSLILFIGSPNDLISSESSPMETDSPKTSPAPIQQFAEKLPTDLSEPTIKKSDDFEFGIIVGLLDGFSKKYVMSIPDSDHLTLSVSDKEIVSIKRNNDSISVTVLFDDGVVSIVLPPGYDISEYRDVLLSCGQMIKERY